MLQEHRLVKNSRFRTVFLVTLSFLLVLVTSLVAHPDTEYLKLKQQEIKTYREVGVRYDSTKLIDAIIAQEFPEKIKALLDAGEDVNACVCEFLRCFNPVLRYAIDRGTDSDSMDIIKMLVDAGAVVNSKTYNRVDDKRIYGMMPMISYAVIYSTPEVVELLITLGADPHLMFDSCSIDSKKTPLEHARELGKDDMIKLLEKYNSIEIEIEL